MGDTENAGFLVKESQNLSGDVLSPGLLMVHDATAGGEDDVPELTRRKQLDNPLLHWTPVNLVQAYLKGSNFEELTVTKLNVVARADASTLVDAATM